MDKLVNFTNISVDDSIRTISNPLVIYCTTNIIAILIGIIVNIIVIAAYKLGDRKLTTNNNSNNNNNVNNNNNNSNIANKFSNLNENIKSSKLANQSRRVSLAVTPTASSSVLAKRNHKSLNHEKKKYSKSDNLVERNKIRRNTSDFNQARNLVRNSSNFNLITTCDTLNLNRHRRTMCSYFILSLGCCDLLICILNMPFNLVIESGIYDSKIAQLFVYSNSNVWCKLVYFLGQIPIVFEIEILLAIAIDRYSSVFHPIKFYFFDKNKSKLTILAQILISCLISLPNLLFFVSNDSNNNNREHSKMSNDNKKFYSIYSLSNYCQVKEDYSLMYSYYQMILFSFFLLNLSIIIIFYLKVYNHIYKVSKHQRIESVGSRASACTNSSIYLANTLTNSNVSMGLIKSKSEEKKIKFSLIDKIANYFKTSSNKSSKEIELEENSNLKNIDEFEIKEEEHASNNNPEADLDQEIQENILEQKIDKSLLYATSGDEIKNDNITTANSNSIRRISCPLVTIQSNEDKPVINDQDKLSQLNEIKKQKMKTKRYRTSSSRSNEMNSNAINFKWRTSVINRLRRFSENHNSFYSRSSSSNYYDFHKNSITTQANTLLFRRHTTRIFRHGKTARILGIATLAFALFWIPYWYYTFKYATDYPDKKTNVSCFVLFKFIKNSFYLNYVLNPLFYSFVNQRFRRNVHILFHIILKFLKKCFCCCKLKSVMNETNKEKCRKKKNIIVVNYDHKTKRANFSNDTNEKKELSSFRNIICFCCSKFHKFK